MICVTEGSFNICDSADPDEMHHYIIWICQSTFTGVLSIQYTGSAQSGKNSGLQVKESQGISFSVREI